MILYLISAALASLLASDPQFRKYSAQVERALAAFDTVKEWADFISFLTKLLKVSSSSLLRSRPSSWLIPFHNSSSRSPDAAVFPVLQRDPKETAGREASLSVFDAGAAEWSASACTRRLQLRLRGHRREFSYDPCKCEVVLIHIRL